MQILKVKLGMYVIDIVSVNVNNKKYSKKNVKGVWDCFEEKTNNIYCKVIINPRTEIKCGAKNMLILTSHQLQH